ncbi:M16 family metallopeptidase [Portibacter marinus]|uniref:M16 family metallopeptidase n=1 Tax=Portibacter marinus TaxID=2898660 RepID=UPI001F3CCC79|nr:pitrilysin family protein [Portibacter marinus]
MKYLLKCLFLLLLLSCGSETVKKESKRSDFKVKFENFELDNGLQVILHVDKSDPVVALALTAHVGSAREKKGRTGFAHLFEHLLFLESENLGKGGLDQMSARIGGSGANGSTSRDRTNYFQTVPKDALEKMIWAEADKLGFFINTVTEPVLAKEKQVVKNEKRQGVDNRPYGHVSYVIGKNLYPENHPYNWQVIGSLEDLQNATLQDVKDFFNRWYTPNNVTLTIAGDIDIEQTKEWVHQYFDEIKSGEEIPRMEKQPVELTEKKKLFYEDNFARLPQLTMTWPTVYQYHPDVYPLEILIDYLSEGKEAPLNKVLIDELQLTSDVTMYNYNSEIAGEAHLQVRAFQDKKLDEVMAGIKTAFAQFEKNGISDQDLRRIKMKQETAFYNSLSSVLGKGFQLAQYEIFAGDPGYINEDVSKILEVNKDDVMRVFLKYMKDQHFVATSFVPKGNVELALSDSEPAEVVEEAIVEGAEEEFDASVSAEYLRTPSTFDRSVEPPYGEAPLVQAPQIWKHKFSNGMELLGITNREVPMVQFLMTIKGGLLLENKNEVGISNILGEMLIRGTANKTTSELEEALEMLGASISIRSDDERMIIQGSTLSRNFDETISLLAEMLLEPRWDEAELALVKQDVISNIQQQSVNPNSIASNEFAKLIYGEGSILANSTLGTETSVKGIEMEDLKTYYYNYFAPNISSVQLTGDVDKSMTIRAFQYLAEQWQPKEVKFPNVVVPDAPAQSKVYFYNIPGAKQSVLRFGYPALAATDEDFYPAEIMNYRLGGGGFASELTQELRETKGYTYGIRSSFTGSKFKGPFTISSGVRSNVTYESSALIQEILSNYASTYNEEDLEITKSSLIKGNARAFETPMAKLRMLTNISQYGYPDDYVKQRETTVEEITLEGVKELARKYVNPDKMYYLVVGDQETQMSKLTNLGYGNPIIINEIKN